MAVTQILRDAKGGQVVLRKLDGGTGEEIEDSPKVLIRLEDCLGSDGNYHQLSIREVCVTVGGVEKTMLVLGSAPYDVP